MISKSWFCGLLAVTIMFCGCGEQTKTPKVKKEAIKPQRNLVKLETSAGDIVIELNAAAAPVTVKNFLGYVQEGFYGQTIFHRVIHGFMIQGGGFTTEMARKETHDPITNEAGNGLRNVRGTIAMARGGDPDSATCQFFINHVDNPPLDYIHQSCGQSASGLRRKCQYRLCRFWQGGRRHECCRHHRRDGNDNA